MKNACAISSLARQLGKVSEKLDSLAMGVQDVEQNAPDLTDVYQGLLLDEIEHVQILTLELTKAVVAAAEETNADEGGSVFDHIFLLAELPDASDGQWLCDVGFAYLFRGPLRMELDVVQPGGPESYLVEAAFGEDEDWLRVVRIRRDGTREPLFSFGPQVYELSDFHERVVFNSTDPSARFSKGPLVCIDAGEGRTVLSYSRLSWLEGGKVVSRTVAPDEVGSVLREVFGLVR